MPSVFIPIRHMSAKPKVKMPKGIEIAMKTMPREFEDGHVFTPYEEDKVLVVVGRAKGPAGEYAFPAWFVYGDFTPFDVFQGRLQEAVNGISHDLRIVAEGGNPKGRVNDLTDKVAERASREFDIAPEEVFS